MSPPRKFSPRHSGSRPGAFTLIELLLVVAIIALLISLAVPEFGRFVDRARSVGCAGNLRSIGISVRNYINDNDGTYPVIETNPEDPIYPEEVGAKGMLETLEPYGLTAATLSCKADVTGSNHFAKRGTSYEWRPSVDDEPALQPKILTRRGSERSVNPARVRLCIDIEPVHNGRMNVLYGDGRVRNF